MVEIVRRNKKKRKGKSQISDMQDLGRLRPRNVRSLNVAVTNEALRSILAVKLQR